MLRDNVRFAWRNLTKHKMYTLVNLLGLTLGLTAFLIIALYIIRELSYDRYHPDADRTYQVVATREVPGQPVRRLANLPAPLADEMERRMQGVENATRVIVLGRADLTWENNGYYETVVAVEPDFFEFFAVQFLRGEPDTALRDPSAIILTQSSATKYFGQDDPIGKTVTSTRGSMTVSAVVADPPDNTHMQFSVLTPFPVYLGRVAPQWQTSWTAAAFVTYVKLNNNVSPEEIGSVASRYLTSESPMPDREFHQLSLLPLADIHFGSNDIEGQYNVAPGNIETVYTLEAVALFLILIACINYTNLATARSISRAQDISLRKIVGAQRSHLIFQLLCEAMTLTAVAMLVALSLAQMLLPAVNGITGNSLTLSILLQPALFLALCALVVLIGLAAGAYPAFYLSRLPVISGIRDHKHSTKHAGRLRKLLVIVQFGLSVVLVFCTLVVMEQVSFVQSMPLGFNKNNVLAIDINSPAMRMNFETIKAELLADPVIEAVSVSSRVPGDWKPIPQVTAAVPGQQDANSERVSYLGADADFLDAYAITRIEGRNFDTSSAPGDVMVNRRFVEQMGWDVALGRQLNLTGIRGDTGAVETIPATVIGVVEDFHYQSLHTAVGPLVIARYDNPLGVIDYYSVRINGNNVANALDRIRSVVQRHDAVTPLEYHFLDAQIDTQYSSDRISLMFFSAAAGLAIFIACVGLFGLSSFTVAQRSREIGIRKVLGATIANIVGLLSADFMRLVLLAIVIALPVGYYLMTLWLAGFAYSTRVTPMQFSLSASLAIVVAMGTVSVQSVRAAMRNPVESIACE